MSLDLINVGAEANDGTGDTPRAAFTKANAAIAALNALGPSDGGDYSEAIADLEESIAALESSQFSGAYADLSGKPSLFSGAYADLSGRPAIPFGFTYDQTLEPTTGLVTGHTWRERSGGGLIIGEWQWTGSLWVAIRTTSIQFTSDAAGANFNNVSATTSRTSQFSFKRAQAISLRVGYSVSTADSSNRWDITTGFGTQQVSAISAFSTATGDFTIYSPATRLSLITALSGVSDGVEENSLYITATRVGTPANLFMSGAALVREVRV
jgi:hypothetical protein